MRSFRQAFLTSPKLGGKTFRERTDQLQRKRVMPLLERMSIVPRPLGEEVQPWRGTVWFLSI